MVASSHRRRTVENKNIPQLKVLATLQGQLALGLALDALQSQHNLLGGLGLLVEDGLGLTTITGLLAVVTTLSLGEKRGLASLVLGDLVLGVLAALLALAVGVSGLGNVDLCSNRVSVRPFSSGAGASSVCGALKHGMQSSTMKLSIGHRSGRTRQFSSRFLRSVLARAVRERFPAASFDECKVFGCVVVIAQVGA